MPDIINTIYEELILIIGTPPEGYEFILYTASCIIMLFITWSMLKIIVGLFNWLSGR